jgi:hypothetical protein
MPCKSRIPRWLSSRVGLVQKPYYCMEYILSYQPGSYGEACNVCQAVVPAAQLGVLDFSWTPVRRRIKQISSLLFSMESIPLRRVRLVKIHLRDLSNRGDDSLGGKPSRHQTSTIRRVPYIQPSARCFGDCVVCC